MASGAAQTGPPLAMLATAAIVGQIVQVASALLLPLVSEFSLVSDNISELALGRYGAVQVAGLLIAGVTTLGLAYVIRQLTRDTWGSRIGSLLVGIYGLGALVIAMIVLTAQRTWHRSPPPA